MVVTPCIREQEDINRDVEVIRLAGRKAKGNNSIELAGTVAKKRRTTVIIMPTVVVLMHQSVKMVAKV